MAAELLDGKALSIAIRAEIGKEVADRIAAGHRPPGLAVILVGANPASQFYVKSKGKACAEAGIHSVQLDRPADITQEQLLSDVQQFNADPAIDGILVQFPLPGGLDEKAVQLAIDPDKDVDGLHPVNAGRLALGQKGFVPCTPLGVKEMLIRNRVETAGQHAVVVGRSSLVGRPMALLLSAKGPGGDATVTVAHSRTRDLAAVVREADILVAAIGRPEAITGDMIKPGAVVVDVGINRVDDPSGEKGYRIVGDVEFEPAWQKASLITPVPGGVGPMTIAMLLRNTLESANRRDPV